MPRAGAAAVSLALLRRKLALKRQSAIFDRLPTMKLDVRTSKTVRHGRVRIEVHPNVFQQIKYEDEVTDKLLRLMGSSDAEKESSDAGSNAEKSNDFFEALSRVVLATSLSESVLFAYGVYDRVRGLGAKDAKDVLVKKLMYDYKIGDKVLKKLIARRMEDLTEALDEIKRLQQTQLVKTQAGGSSRIRKLWEMMAALVWGSKSSDK